MSIPKLGFGEALLHVLTEPQNWRDFGYSTTALGFASAPEWWQYSMGFGFAVCPIIARFLQVIKDKRMEG